MSKNKFFALLFVTSSSIFRHMKKDKNEISIDDVHKFYNSKLYKVLEDEDSKLWHFSSLTLYKMYMDELEYGDFDYPEVAA